MTNIIGLQNDENRKSFTIMSGTAVDLSKLEWLLYYNISAHQTYASKQDCQTLLKAKYSPRVAPVASAGRNNVANWFKQARKNKKFTRPWPVTYDLDIQVF